MLKSCSTARLPPRPTVPRPRLRLRGLGLLAAAGACAALALPAAAAERFPDLSPEKMSPEQKAIADAIATGPRKSIAGPFKAWLRSPVLADRLQKVGEYVRFQSSLPKRLNEFAILITGRFFNSGFEWDYHYPLALKAGVPEAVLKDLARGTEPQGMNDDEALVYRVSMELHRHGAVSDATYEQALARFGERGVIDLIAVNGYYDLVCMTLNVAQVSVPPESNTPRLADTTQGPAFSLPRLPVDKPLLPGAKEAVARCGVCHSFEKGGRAKVGPTLFGVAGNAKGAVPRFPYSAAMKERGGTWTTADLDAYLTRPRVFLPGTSMTFAGIESAEKRADIIAYLRTLSR